MTVRRLAPKELQPASFTFSDENLAFAKKEIAKYPPGRQASAAIAIALCEPKGALETRTDQ